MLERPASGRWRLPPLFSFLGSLLRDEGGQGTVEYILILSACVVGTVQLAKAILKMLDDGILFLGGQLEKDLKTGRAPLNVWKN